MSRNLFDLIKDVTRSKRNVSELTDEDWKVWSNFMVTRWLSMDIDLVEFANEVQVYSNSVLTPKDFYRFLYHILPEGPLYLKYVKRTSAFEIDAQFIDIIRNHLQISRRRVYEYIELLMNDGGIQYIIDILNMYGLSDESVQKFVTQVSKKR
mgnify:FL=1